MLVCTDVCGLLYDCALCCRYVKLFPLLNLHSEGLQKFSSFVCEEVCTYACMALLHKDPSLFRSPNTHKHVSPLQVSAVGSATVKRLQAAWDSGACL